MEKPTYTAIDYNSKENKVIEERIRNYYLPVKNTFEAVLYGRLNIPDSPRGRGNPYAYRRDLEWVFGITYQSSDGGK